MHVCIIYIYNYTYNIYIYIYIYIYGSTRGCSDSAAAEQFGCMIVMNIRNIIT